MTPQSKPWSCGNKVRYGPIRVWTPVSKTSSLDPQRPTRLLFTSVHPPISSFTRPSLPSFADPVHPVGRLGERYDLSVSGNKAIRTPGPDYPPSTLSLSPSTCRLTTQRNTERVLGPTRLTTCHVRVAHITLKGLHQLLRSLLLIGK